MTQIYVAGDCPPGFYKTKKGREIIIVSERAVTAKWAQVPPGSIPYKSPGDPEDANPLKRVSIYGWLPPTYELIPQEGHFLELNRNQALALLFLTKGQSIEDMNPKMRKLLTNKGYLTYDGFLTDIGRKAVFVIGDGEEVTQPKPKPERVKKARPSEDKKVPTGPELPKKAFAALKMLEGGAPIQALDKRSLKPLQKFGLVDDSGITDVGKEYLKNA